MRYEAKMMPVSSSFPFLYIHIQHIMLIILVAKSLCCHHNYLTEDLVVAGHLNGRGNMILCRVLYCISVSAIQILNRF